jgi:putative hemolysin
MRGDTDAGFKPGAMQNWFRPELARDAAKAAANWLKPAQRGIDILRPDFATPSIDTLGRLGSLEVRLATSRDDIKRAQKLRYKVFYRDGTAIADAPTLLARRDKDMFDKICDHVLVIDHDAPLTRRGKQQVVGTYRLLRQEIAQSHGGFYTGEEFDIAALIERHRNLRFLELGRSCVLPEYRSKRTIELLWQGIWAYINHYGIGVMAGCASFHGTVPAAHAEALSFLAHRCRTSAEFDVRAVPGRYRSMDLMPAEAVNARSAALALPPLIKGYLRLGAKVGDGCVVDHEFDTVDVFVVLPVREIDRRYISYYGEAHRFAA